MSMSGMAYGEPQWPATYPMWSYTPPSCEHCYCEEPTEHAAYYKPDHLKCCKCSTVMHRKFVPFAVELESTD